MRIPYFLQGALFAPVLALLIFILKVTCPAPSGGGCFADTFLTPIFLPLDFIYKIFGQTNFILTHEPSIILVYWMIIGLFIGLCFDLLKQNEA